jgi:hypothetical protein
MTMYTMGDIDHLLDIPSTYGQFSYMSQMIVNHVTYDECIHVLSIIKLPSCAKKVVTYFFY